MNISEMQVSLRKFHHICLCYCKIALHIAKLFLTCLTENLHNFQKQEVPIVPVPLENLGPGGNRGVFRPGGGFGGGRLRVEPAMTSLVIPDLIRDPLHPYARMRLRVEPAMTSLVIPDTSRYPSPLRSSRTPIRDPVHRYRAEIAGFLVPQASEIAGRRKTSLTCISF